MVAGVLRWVPARALLLRLLSPARGLVCHLPYYVAEGALLDVGCGAGAYLARMRELGWQVYGVEPNARAAEYCRSTLGATVHGGNLMSAHFPDSHFDVVNFSHVLEHLHSPSEALAEAFRIMKSGGQLIIQVPNPSGYAARLFRGDWFAWELPRHLYHFPPKTLRRKVIAVGFSDVDLHYGAQSYVALVSLSYALERRFGKRIALDRSRVLRMLYHPVGALLSGIGASDYLTITATKRP
jgi:SAM-dependent methyltransferase